MFKCSGICSECGRCKDAGMIAGANNRKTKILEMPDDFVPLKGGAGYGMAFDIGTTTVVGMLWDMEEAKLLGALAKTNPQNEHGLDVISRITFIGEDEKNLSVMHESIIDCLNKISKKLCVKQHLQTSRIIRATVCGNTTMSHIFAGYDPAPLAMIPFAPAYTGPIYMNGKESGLDMDPKGKVMLMPNIAGHVGGDIVAGILASRLLGKKKLTLFTDIGTNGEIVITDGKRSLACSTAAGPAFEGAAIYQGMRAAPGAIEKLKIEKGDVLFKTIDDVPPVGICGSGLIDTVAQMIRAGLINKKGRIADPRKYKEEHGASELAGRIREAEDGREFVLVYKTDGEDIVITQKDVREVQLAKGAVSAGISIMLEQLGKKENDIDSVIIAGAFGNFIDKESAVTIGLLPEMPLEKIFSAGNTAGAGTLMALADEKEAKAAVDIPNGVEHVELAEDPEFQTKYLRAMAF